MFKGNPRLKDPKELTLPTKEEQIEYLKCKKDIIYFAEKYVTILTLDHGKQKIELYDFQKKLLKSFVSGKINDKQHRILLMGRQSGKTTICTVYYLWLLLFQEDKKIAILANKLGIAREILGRIKMAYLELPYFLKQGTVTWNKTSVELDNDCGIYAFSSSSDSIRGLSFPYVYCDEFAFVPNHVASDFMDSVYPVLTSGENSQMIVTSTPKGMNHFYDLWDKARKGKNGFYPIRINWWEIPKRDLAWKKQIIKDVGARKFAQEFACRFLGSSKTLIGAEYLEEMKLAEPLYYDMEDDLEIFEAPLPRDKMGTTQYVLGVDIGKGVGGDSSVIQVLRIDNKYSIKQVAKFSSNMISTFDLAQVIYNISEFYNDAVAMVENNSIGESTIKYLTDILEFEHLVIENHKSPGINANSKTKIDACYLLRDYIENDYLEVVDEKTFEELSCFEQHGKSFRANGNGHDDCVMALLWALYFIKSSWFDDQLTEEDDRQRMFKEKFKISKNIREMISGKKVSKKEVNDLEEKIKQNVNLASDDDFDVSTQLADPDLVDFANSKGMSMPNSKDYW